MSLAERPHDLTHVPPTEQLLLTELHPHRAYELVLEFFGKSDPDHELDDVITVLIYRDNSKQSDQELFKELYEQVQLAGGVPPSISTYLPSNYRDFIFPAEFALVDCALNFSEIAKKLATEGIRIAVGSDAYSAARLLATTAECFVLDPRLSMSAIAT
jgi:hypothetical protein